ncbi:MarR family transcriptional regulator [Haloarcula laminariae]|uniref:MarR family transcriptional regulator n=1 Tax=Haloarcula laminariae TaxID=2961577 RepID=UPI0024055BBA|nr:MarR family transcriptional regulator [Halomicroarcula sp. FL173]
MRDAEIDVDPGTAKSEVVEFLYMNLELGYEPAEIAAELDMSQETATALLKELYRVDYAGRTENGYYHGLWSQAPLRRYTSSVKQVKRMFDQPDDVQNPPDYDPESIDEAALEAELAELEEELR